MVALPELGIAGSARRSFPCGPYSLALFQFQRISTGWPWNNMWTPLCWFAYTSHLASHWRWTSSTRGSANSGLGPPEYHGQRSQLLARFNDQSVQSVLLLFCFSLAFLCLQVSLFSMATLEVSVLETQPENPQSGSETPNFSQFVSF